MRTGRIARTIGQAAVAGLLGLGVSVAGGQAAQADDYTWESDPADGPAGGDDYTWETGGDSATHTNDYTWE